LVCFSSNTVEYNSLIAGTDKQGDITTTYTWKHSIILYPLMEV
jgi:hypothetical protein